MKIKRNTIDRNIFRIMGEYGDTRSMVVTFEELAEIYNIAREFMKEKDIEEGYHP